MRRAHLGAIRQLVRRQIHLAKRPLADQPADGVIADRLELGVGEFAALSAPPMPFVNTPGESIHVL